MKMTNLTKLVLVTLPFFGTTAVAKESGVRLVISSYVDTNKAHTASVNSEPLCVATPDNNNQWCMEEITRKTHGLATQATLSSRQLKTQVVTLDSYGYSPQQVAQSLRETGKFDEVVADVKVNHARLYTQEDPIKSIQDKYFGSPEISPSGSDVYGASVLIGEPHGESIDVLVMDSSFYDTDDVEYLPGSGRSFVTSNGEIPNDDYHPTTTDGCNGHGLSVAGVIGGSINNGKGGDGVTNAVNLHPIRVMQCGEGYLSDISRALRWANGNSENIYIGDVSEASPYEGNVGIINISITGYTGSIESGDDYSGCPIFMQESIDSLVEAGWTIVVAAGNDFGEDIRDYSPANCDGVISVGALDASGDKAPFSNIGDELTVSAHGTLLATSCDAHYDAYCEFSGTSAASPLVAGILAMVRQHTDIDNKTLESLLKLTATSDNFGPDCQEQGCGAGLINAKALLQAVTQSQEGTLNTISFALGKESECEQSWFLDHFGSLARMCEMYTVKMLGGYKKDNATYRLLSVPEGNALSDSAVQTIIGDFSHSEFMLEGLDITGNDFGFQVCQDGDCGEVYEINTYDAEENMRPISCI